MVIPTPRSVENWLNKTCRWFLLHPYLTLTLVVLAMLGPFLTKPFNVDDPLFIWAAHQIQAHPGNPYGFNVNWYGTMQPMWDVTKNPPLACYYLALAAGIFGWGEIALHFAFLLPAVAAIIGAYQLARRFCDHPMLAALVTLFTPVFLISGTTVMCDVPMLAFWIWAVVLWIDGTKQNDFGRLAGGIVNHAGNVDQILRLVPRSTAGCLQPDEPTPAGTMDRVSADSVGGTRRLSIGHVDVLRTWAHLLGGRQASSGSLPVLKHNDRFDGVDLHGRMSGWRVLFCAIVLAETNVGCVSRWSNLARLGVFLARSLVENICFDSRPVLGVRGNPNGFLGHWRHWCAGAGRCGRLALA